MINNKFYCIDAHCHIYPEKIAAAAVDNTDRFYGVTSAFAGTIDSLLLAGDNAGVDRFIVQSVATTPKQVLKINDFIAESVQKYPDRFVGVGTLHPDSETLKEDVRHIVDLGFHGVKLHPDIQQFKIDDYRCLKIYELCEENNLPVLMHTGDKRYDFSNPNRLLPILNIYKGLTVIGAHFGGYSVWETAAEELAGTQNLYVDCSSSFFKMDASFAKDLILKYGVDRVLFGSDFPMWDAKDDIKVLLDMNLSDDDYIKIFSENAKKVYKITD